MTKMELALMIMAALLMIMCLLKLMELLALAALRKLFDRLAGTMIGWRIEMDEMTELLSSTKNKPPDADPQALAESESKAPMVRMAAETLRRRRSEATR